MMYSRKEDIEVENLDWKSYKVPSPVNKNVQISQVQLIPAAKDDRTPVYEKNDLSKTLDIRKKITDSLNKNLKLFFIFAVIVFPYIIGFLVSYFLFYFYADMTLDNFLTRLQWHLHIELWVIGSYLLVTVGVIWIVFKSLFGSFKN